MEFICANILDVFGLDWVSMLIYLGNFLLLLAVVIPLIYIPTKKMLKNKRDDLNKIYSENEKLKAESETQKAEYEKMTEDMKLENARVAASVAQAAQERADAIVKDAQVQAQSIVDNAKKHAATQSEQLKTEYRNSVNTLAVEIAQKLLDREITEKDNTALIEEVLSDWEDGN